MNVYMVFLSLSLFCVFNVLISRFKIRSGLTVRFVCAVFIFVVCVSIYYTYIYLDCTQIHFYFAQITILGPGIRLPMKSQMRIHNFNISIIWMGKSIRFLIQLWHILYKVFEWMNKKCSVLWPNETVAKYVCKFIRIWLLEISWLCFNLIANAVKLTLIPIAVILPRPFNNHGHRN